MGYAKSQARYGFKCLNCKMTRYFGVARLRMEVEAGKHARRYDTHRIELLEVTVYAEFGLHDNQDTLESSEDPPF